MPQPRSATFSGRIVIGIDPGTATTGYGVIRVEGQTLTYLDCGVISTTKGLPSEMRLRDLYYELTELIAKWKPVLAVVENIFFSSNVKTAIDVAQARGVILLAIANSQLPLVGCNPMEVKQALTSYGRAPKKQMQEMVKLILKLPRIPTPDDAADALALAIAGSNRRLG